MFKVVLLMPVIPPEFQKSIPRFAAALAREPELLAALHRGVQEGKVTVRTLQQIGAKFVALPPEKKAHFPKLTAVAAKVVREGGAAKAVALLAKHISDPKRVIVPKFNLADIFNITKGRTWRGYFIHPLVELLFALRNHPSEYRGNFYWPRVMNSSWLVQHGYVEEVREAGQVFRPIVIVRRPEGPEGKSDAKAEHVLSVHPVARKLIDVHPAAVGEGLASFEINVFDPRYFKIARAMARGLSRLSKRKVTIKYEGFAEDRPYKRKLKK